jgi:hypothetical protein
MKFLVLTKPYPGAPMPKDPAVYQATMAWVKKGLESGQLDCIYQLVSRGGVAIGNANSAEEMWGAIASYPFFEQFEWEIEPLVDLSFVLNFALERLK